LNNNITSAYITASFEKEVCVSLIVRNIKAIMVLSGGLTATVAYAAAAPGPALESTFGESLTGPLAELLVRNWGVLVALIGAMLIHGAFNPASRRVALLAAAVSKVWFIALVLSNGTRYLGYGAGTAVAVDTLMVIMFVSYLAATRHEPAGTGAERRASLVGN
jgi:lysylphosphatidylglycerol synthetase-like protein (DUF2156 family)